MIFNFNRDKQFTSEIKLKEEPLEIVDEVKLLGVIITSDLKWRRNTDYLTKKANKKMRMLHIAAKYTRNKDNLKHIYKTFVRSTLEFSSTLWHNSLTIADRQDLERIQKAALKVILQSEYEDYKQALGVLNLDTLNQRRESMALKFAKNGLKDPQFSKLFPLRRVEHGMVARNSEKYHVNNSNTSRYKASAVPSLQRLLNRDNKEKRLILKGLFNGIKSNQETKKKKVDIKDPNLRVNYVCNVDVIT